MQFTSIDFETANAKRHSPCAIGIVVANEHEIVDEFYSLINPLVEFSSFNIAVHGITPSDIADAPTFSEVWPTLHSYLAGNLVIAHNASFDMSVIRNTLDYFQIAYPEMDYLCTANISKKVWPDLMNHKLNTVATHHGIAFEHHHALEDARVAAYVFQHAMRHYDGGVDTLLNNCNMRKGRIFDHGYTTPKMKKATRRQRIYL
ncbi:3'-5' exonuclease [Lentibacillus sp. Marseille-P4043]|uniref:3'-5' exonuclease n=1 Tax=Lentibacillus sp. Marseille-P4043 TaxID=2040293 RepID=UPI000D0B3210|nr:3'-5' exonuclease [Lentibacillus sp. Marseille-P4043]